MINFLFLPIDAVDSLLDFIPFGLRLILYGAICGVAAMALYVLFSNQDLIRDYKQRIRDVRNGLMQNDISRQEMMRLTRRNLALSFGMLGHVFLPAMGSSIPVLAIAAWLAVYHSYVEPEPGELVRVSWAPPNASLQIEGSNGEGSSGAGEATIVAGADVAFADAAGQALFTGVPREPAMSVIHQRRWWNALIANPHGYLPEGSPVDAIHFDYALKRVFDGLPDWMSTWEFTYFVTLFIAALGVKVAFRIE